MFLIEHDGKALLSRHGIAVPEGFLVDGLRSGIVWPSSRVALKAQMTSGGRGKVGLVRVVPSAQADSALMEIAGLLVERGAAVLVRVEKALELRGEYYMACRVDDNTQAIEIIFSINGGVDVESQAHRLTRIRVDPVRGAYPQDLIGPLRSAGTPPELLGAAARMAATLCRALVREDAELIEINPLGVLADGSLVALDAKVILDDSAHDRHPERASLTSAKAQKAGLSALEQRAAARGFQFVDMPGDIAVLTSGAGQGMLLADMLADRGWRAANFADASGGGSSDTVRALVELVFERARRDDVKGILAYFVTSATPIDRVVQGLVDALHHHAPPKPMAMGISSSGAAVSSMSLDEAQGILDAEGYPCCTTIYQTLDRLESMLADVR